MLEEKVAGAVVRSYTLGDVVLGQQSPGEAADSPLYFLTDGHGSTRLALDIAGGQPTSGVSRFAYDAYGNALGFAASAAVTDVLYSGQLFDKSTGLQFLRARYYDPASGRFTATDPFAGWLTWPATLSDYGYVGGNPINWIDPSGLWLFDLDLLQRGINAYNTADSGAKAPGGKMGRCSF